VGTGGAKSQSSNFQIRAARIADNGRLEPVDRMWQNPNRVPAAQGPVVVVDAVRRRAA